MNVLGRERGWGHYDRSSFDAAEAGIVTSHNGLFKRRNREIVKQ